MRTLEDAGAPSRLQLSKGVHIVVDRERAAGQPHRSMAAADRRSVFAVPKGRATYIGTTDAFYPDADLWPRIERADADYLIEAATRCFSTPPLREADITLGLVGRAAAGGGSRQVGVGGLAQGRGLGRGRPG